MHQTFYIDIDEEITSIVDRLRKSKANEIVIVVPKRALLIQSIVNLKLLRKEAESLKRQIMIVTQDKLGKLLIEKAGILVQQKLDEGLEDVLIFEDEDKEKEKVEIEDKKRTGKLKKSRDLGSDDYSPENSMNESEIVLSEKKNKEDKKDEFENITNKELVTDISREIKHKRGIFGRKKEKAVRLDMIKNVKIKEEGYLPENEIGEEETFFSRSVNFSKTTGKKEGTSKKLEKFFSKSHENTNFSKPVRDNIPKINISKKFHKFFMSFGALVIIAVLMVGAYLFLPKASVKIYARNKTITLDSEIKGDKKVSHVDLDKESIPANEISVEGEISQNFDSSGEKAISNQKAKGKITIYNEYTSAEQPLVATTRFLSENGKIFRLSSGVNVPGFEKVGAEIKPGVIEANVVADEPGEDFNIGPSSFTIPGFKDSGNEKYTKFYAKSTNAMSGGGSGNEKMGMITQSDIDKAKNKVLSDLNLKIKGDLKQKAGEGYIIPDEAVIYEDAQYLISNSVGEVSNNFSLTVKSKARALAVKESDIKNLLSEKVIKKGDANNSENISITLEFGKTDADFNVGEIIMRIHSTIVSGPKLDLGNLKKGILGKNEDQLKAYLTSYPDVEKVVVDYWPPFISGKIPLYENRVNISLDNI
jgi:hypothetical protein